MLQTNCTNSYNLYFIYPKSIFILYPVKVDCILTEIFNLIYFIIGVTDEHNGFRTYSRLYISGFIRQDAYSVLSCDGQSITNKGKYLRSYHLDA